jgi:hypothetical protein
VPYRPCPSTGLALPSSARIRSQGQDVRDRYWRTFPDKFSRAGEIVEIMRGTLLPTLPSHTFSPLHSSSPNPLWTIATVGLARSKHQTQRITQAAFCETCFLPVTTSGRNWLSRLLGTQCLLLPLAPDCNIPMKQWLTAGSSTTINPRGEQAVQADKQGVDPSIAAAPPRTPRECLSIRLHSLPLSNQSSAVPTPCPARAPTVRPASRTCASSELPVTVSSRLRIPSEATENDFGQISICLGITARTQ